MKKFVLALFVMALAVAGAQLVHIENHDSAVSLEIGTAPAAAELCGTSPCTKVDIQSSDGAIGTSTNSATYVGKCYLVNEPNETTAAGVAYWALLRYASVATGDVLTPHYYAVPTSEPVWAEVNTRFANGAYGKAVTGSVTSRCGYTK